MLLILAISFADLPALLALLPPNSNQSTGSRRGTCHIPTMSSSAVTLLDLSHAIGQQASSAKVASSPASSQSSGADPSASSSAADLLKQSGGPAIIALPDPVSTDGEERDYLVVPSTNDGKDNCCDIFEVQSLTGPSKYGSFFVGPRVVSDGGLRVATRVDPLFFVLAAVEAKSKQQQAANTNANNSDPNKSQSAMGGNSKWQPLDQLLADVHPCVREALRNSTSNADLTPEKVLDKQMRHLFLYTDAYGDDLPFYKFDEKLARKWLRAKFDRSLGAARASILREKLREDKAKSEASKLGGGGGAFSSAFNMGDDDDEEVATKPVVSQSPSCSQTSAATSSASSPTAGGANASIAMLSPEDETRARISALQLVCEYLPDAWRAKLMEEVEMTEEQLLGPRGKKRKAASPEASKASSMVDEDDVGASMCFDDDEDLTAPPSSSSSNKWADNGNSAADRMLQITRGVDGCGGAAGSTANVMMDDEEREKLKKKEEKLNAKSHGLKKLAKVNTKGMKSLSSFFGGGPKKKKKV